MLGQFNIARARWPLDDPRMAEFMDAVAMMHAVAARSPGYVWHIDEPFHPGAPQFPGDPLMTFTLSVWTDLDCLRRFTWSTIHKRFRLRREEWFEKLDGPYLAIWPIPDGHLPDGEEALAMLDLLAREGPSDRVFGTETLSAEHAA